MVGLDSIEKGAPHTRSGVLLPGRSTRIMHEFFPSLLEGGHGTRATRHAISRIVLALAAGRHGHRPRSVLEARHQSLVGLRHRLPDEGDRVHRPVNSWAPRALLRRPLHRQGIAFGNEPWSPLLASSPHSASRIRSSTCSTMVLPWAPARSRIVDVRRREQGMRATLGGGNLTREACRAPTDRAGARSRARGPESPWRGARARASPPG